MAYRLRIIPEGIATEDGRGVAPEALTWRGSPMPLMWTPVNGEGHDGAVVVGAFSDVHRATVDGTTGLVADTVVWDTGPAAMEARRMVDEGTMRSLSADLDVDTVRVEMQGVDGATEWVEAGVLLGATLVPVQAYEWAQVEVDDGDVPVEGDMPDDVMLDELIASAEATVNGLPAPTTKPEPVPVLTAHAGPAPADVVFDLPPVEWFATAEPDADDDSVVWVNEEGVTVPAHTEGARPWGVPLTITADGRVYGNIASWLDCHTGFEDRCVPPPKSHSGYAWYHTGVTPVVDGDPVPTGRITVGTGHAGHLLSAAAAVAHYDNTGHTVADVHASDGVLGPWVAGWVRPWATAQQRHELAAHPPSGDWRPRGGHPELLGVLAVNVAGFPMPRTVATFRKDDLVSLVASGLPPRAPSQVDEVRARLEAVEARLDAAAILGDLT